MSSRPSALHDSKSRIPLAVIARTLGDGPHGCTDGSPADKTFEVPDVARVVASDGIRMSILSLRDGVGADWKCVAIPGCPVPTGSASPGSPNTQGTGHLYGAPLRDTETLSLYEKLILREVGRIMLILGS